MDATFTKLDDIFLGVVQDLVAPCDRLAVAIVVEEQDLVMITKSVYRVGSMELILPGCWDAIVVTGDFEGLVVDKRGMLEDVIVLCEALNLNHVVEY